MRTTVTIDDDVAAAIDAARAATGESFREAINRLVRRGLRQQAAGEAIPLPLLSGRPKVDITDVSSILGALDDDRLLERGGP